MNIIDRNDFAKKVHNTEDPDIVCRKLKKIMLDGAKANGISLHIKDFVIHSYQCKKAYCISGTVNGESFLITDKKPEYVNIYDDLYDKLLFKYIDM